MSWKLETETLEMFSWFAVCFVVLLHMLHNQTQLSPTCRLKILQMKKLFTFVLRFYEQCKNALRFVNKVINYNRKLSACQLWKSFLAKQSISHHIDASSLLVDEWTKPARETMLQLKELKAYFKIPTKPLLLHCNLTRSIPNMTWMWHDELT